MNQFIWLPATFFLGLALIGLCYEPANAYNFRGAGNDLSDGHSGGVGLHLSGCCLGPA